MKKLTTLFLIALTLGGCSLFQKKEDSTTTTQTQTQSKVTTTSSTTTTKQTKTSTTAEPTTVVSTTVEQKEATVPVPETVSTEKVVIPAEQPKPSSMDLQAIKQGDFRSVEGTWRNSAGWEIHIDKEGKISSSHGNLKVGITKQQYQEGLLNWIMVPENNENTFVGGAVFSFIPQNVELTYGLLPGEKDQSDISKDRIFGTQTVTDGKTVKNMMYYKVD